MEERYKLESYHEAFCEIHDTKLDEWYIRKDLVTNLLNQQDKEIKKLTTELKNYKLCRCVDCSTEYEHGLETTINELEVENSKLEAKYQVKCQIYQNTIDELHKSQKQTAINELEKFANCITKNLWAKAEIGSKEECIYSYINKLIDRQITKLKREERTNANR